MKIVDRYSTTVQLPKEVDQAISKAVMDSFETAKDKFNHSETYPQYLKMTQACEYLNISYGTLKKWIKNKNGFPYHEIDGITRFNRDELDKFMASK